MLADLKLKFLLWQNYEKGQPDDTESPAYTASSNLRIIHITLYYSHRCLRHLRLLSTFIKPCNQFLQHVSTACYKHIKSSYHIIWICYGAPIRSSEAPYRVKYRLNSTTNR